MRKREGVAASNKCEKKTENSRMVSPNKRGESDHREGRFGGGWMLGRRSGRLALVQQYGANKLGTRRRVEKKKKNFAGRKKAAEERKPPHSLLDNHA